MVIKSFEITYNWSTAIDSGFGSFIKASTDSLLAKILPEIALSTSVVKLPLLVSFILATTGAKPYSDAFAAYKLSCAVKTSFSKGA
ncbi:hypothetical protein D3C85_1614270 [compost metagenome]